MQQEKIKHYIKLVFKTILGVAVYFFFLIYTPTIYGNVVGFWNETFFDERVIVLGQSVIEIKVADSIPERQKGLSGTEKLKDNQGLFFIFETEDRHGIWMKDMNYPIDIIWLDKYGAVVYVEKDVSPDTYPKVFKPEKPSLYVLEVNSGFVDREEIKIGDTIDLY